MIPRVFQVVTASGLNLRAGPGVEYPSRAVLRHGAAVEVMEFGGAWLAVRSAEGPGWVASRYTAAHPTPWYAVVREEQRRGVREVAGREDNPRIIEYHSATLLKATSDEVAWCSSLQCWAMEQVGIRSPRSAAARDWLKWGREISDFIEGCIAVFRRGSNPESGHVANPVRREGSDLWVLGGNQSNRICEADFPELDLLGFRMPAH